MPNKLLPFLWVVNFYVIAVVNFLIDKHTKIVAERLGDADIKILLSTYAHVLPSMQEEAAEAIEEIIFNSNKPDDAKDEEQ